MVIGIDGQPMVYLDLTHIDAAERSTAKLEGILEIYEKFVGDDPRKVPMKIFPGMHYTMGGLWVDFDQHDQYSRHLRRRRGGVQLSMAPIGWVRTRSLSCIFGGFMAGPNALKPTRRASPAQARERRSARSRAQAAGTRSTGGS